MKFLTPESPISDEPAVAADPPKKQFDRSITEGPLARAVWKIAWPTMLTNVIAGMQNLVDQILVGNLIGYKANAAIGVSNQIFILVIVFISSLFIGMSVMVARFAGAHNPEKVNRTVYQAFLAAVLIAVFIMAPLGYFASPYLLDLISGDAGVKAEALPFQRLSFALSIVLLSEFISGGAVRAAGQAGTRGLGQAQRGDRATGHPGPVRGIIFLREFAGGVGIARIKRRILAD